MVSRHPLRVKNKFAIRALKKKKQIQKTAYRRLHTECYLILLKLKIKQCSRLCYLGIYMQEKIFQEWVYYMAIN